MQNDKKMINGDALLFWDKGGGFCRGVSERGGAVCDWEGCGPVVIRMQWREQSRGSTSFLNYSLHVVQPEWRENKVLNSGINNALPVLEGERPGIFRW